MSLLLKRAVHFIWLCIELNIRHLQGVTEEMAKNGPKDNLDGLELPQTGSPNLALNILTAAFFGTSCWWVIQAKKGEEKR